jgi:hypothetical protein
MAAEAAVAVEERADCSVRKRAKMVSQPRSPDVSADSPQVVLVSKDRLDTATALPPRRQYLTRSKVTASAFADQDCLERLVLPTAPPRLIPESREAQFQPHPPPFDIL